jgi:hypothetical protein
MASEGGVDTSQARVQTYVPAYQKEEWQAHADELGMSLSEFVRSMVQAGRRGFTGESASGSEPTGEEPGGRADSDADPRGSRLEDRVLSTLADGDSYDWDELVAAVTDDLEAQLDEVLQELQARDEIRYSGREGGYVRK